MVDKPELSFYSLSVGTISLVIRNYKKPHNSSRFQRMKSVEVNVETSAVIQSCNPSQEIEMWLSRVFTLAILFFPQFVAAQQVTASGGAVAGEIVSASAVFLASSAGDVLTTPPEQHFVLTTFCAAGNTRLAGSTFGFIADTDGSGCVNFSPGVALPSEETLTCAPVGAAGNTGRCHVSGVLSVR